MLRIMRKPGRDDNALVRGEETILAGPYFIFEILWRVVRIDYGRTRKFCRM